jgi:hypothetical protein
VCRCPYGGGVQLLSKVGYFDDAYLLPYSMRQSPSWEANRFSGSQEISRILWNPKVHYRIHNGPPPVPILSQLDQVHTPLTSRRSVLILSSHLHLALPSGFFPAGFPSRTLYTPLLSPHTCYMPIPSRFYTRTVLGEQYSSINFSLWSFLHSPITSSLFRL